MKNFVACSIAAACIAVIPTCAHGMGNPINPYHDTLFPRIVISLSGGINFNIHSGNVQQNQPYACELFDNGSGQGGMFSAAGEYDFNRMFGASLQIGYSNYYAEFLSQTGQAEIQDSNADYLSEYTWRPAIAYLAVEPAVKFSPGNPRVWFQLGPTVNFALNKNFTETNDIVTANGPPFTFSNGSNTRIVASGPIQGLRSVILGLEAGVSYQFRLWGKEFIAPFAVLHYFLESPSSTFPWTVVTLRIGASIQWSMATGD